LQADVGIQNKMQIGGKRNARLISYSIVFMLYHERILIERRRRVSFGGIGPEKVEGARAIREFETV
jgi:hypothetical protein